MMVASIHSLIPSFQFVHLLQCFMFAWFLGHVFCFHLQCLNIFYLSLLSQLSILFLSTPFVVFLLSMFQLNLLSWLDADSCSGFHFCHCFYLLVSVFWKAIKRELVSLCILIFAHPELSFLKLLLFFLTLEFTVSFTLTLRIMSPLETSQPLTLNSVKVSR